MDTSSAVTSFTVTSDLVQPLVSSVNSALDTLVPVGIGIMATFIGVRLVKRIIFMFL